MTGGPNGRLTFHDQIDQIVMSLRIGKPDKLKNKDEKRYHDRVMLVLLDPLTGSFRNYGSVPRRPSDENEHTSWVKDLRNLRESIKAIDGSKIRAHREAFPEESRTFEAHVRKQLHENEGGDETDANARVLLSWIISRRELEFPKLDDEALGRAFWRLMRAIPQPDFEGFAGWCYRNIYLEGSLRPGDSFRAVLLSDPSEPNDSYYFGFQTFSRRHPAQVSRVGDGKADASRFRFVKLQQTEEARSFRIWYTETLVPVAFPAQTSPDSKTPTRVYYVAPILWEGLFRGIAYAFRTPGELALSFSNDERDFDGLMVKAEKGLAARDHLWNQHVGDILSEIPSRIQNVYTFEYSQKLSAQDKSDHLVRTFVTKLPLLFPATTIRIRNIKCPVNGKRVDDIELKQEREDVGFTYCARQWSESSKVPEALLDPCLPRKRSQVHVLGMPPGICALLAQTPITSGNRNQQYCEPRPTPKVDTLRVDAWRAMKNGGLERSDSAMRVTLGQIDVTVWFSDPLLYGDPTLRANTYLTSRALELYSQLEVFGASRRALQEVEARVTGDHIRNWAHSLNTIVRPLVSQLQQPASTTVLSGPIGGAMSYLSFVLDALQEFPKLQNLPPPVNVGTSSMENRVFSPAWNLVVQRIRYAEHGEPYQMVRDMYTDLGTTGADDTPTIEDLVLAQRVEITGGSGDFAIPVTGRYAKYPAVVGLCILECLLNAFRHQVKWAHDHGREVLQVDVDYQHADPFVIYVISNPCDPGCVPDLGRSGLRFIQLILDTLYTDISPKPFWKMEDGRFVAKIPVYALEEV